MRELHRARVLAAVGVAVVVLAFAAVVWLGRQRPASRSAAPMQGVPRQELDGTYLSSTACRGCHPSQYASWHASYHRKMTQLATPDAVQASFNGETFDLGEATARLSRRGDEYWVELTAHSGDPEKRERRVVMTTGAHHMQGFWVARGSASVSGVSASGGSGNLLDQLPLMWLVGDSDEPGRWVPIGDSFLTPPGKKVDTPWNAACIFCHSVNGQPHLDRRAMAADSTVAELGIACEACHGPGRAHVEAHKVAPTLRGGQQPVAGVGSEPRLGAPALFPDDNIVQPAHLPSERSAQVCGHCHSVAKFVDERLLDEWHRSGSRFRPGDDLNLTRLTLLPARWAPEELAEFQESHASFFAGNFWPDGMVRVAGREYNGLVESACYQRGGMTCVSCHSLHQSDPNDQLAAGMDGNHACYQCHDSYRETLVAHTHHPANSSGSLCYNCHMPHTTYGLFKGIRSHQISSPSVAATLATGRPNACNLCHLDQTLQWTSKNLNTWYGQPAAELDDDDHRIAAAVLWLLRGDAVQRALAAYAAGWPAARKASGEDWLPPLLVRLLDDPYAAVRLVAYRSLGSLGYPIDYDFTGAPEHRAVARHEVMERWKSLSTERKRFANTATLQDANGKLDLNAAERLAAERHDQPVTIQE
ncbi:MAG TPA: cytochrome c3 family protein [Pirellulales bacterium]